MVFKMRIGFCEVSSSLGEWMPFVLNLMNTSYGSVLPGHSGDFLALICPSSGATGTFHGLSCSDLSRSERHRDISPKLAGFSHIILATRYGYISFFAQKKTKST